MKCTGSLTLLVLLVSLSVCSVHAQQNSKQRQRTLSSLPDWSGVWEQFRISENGSPVDPVEDKAFHDALVERPPYNPTWEAKFPLRKGARPGEDRPTCRIGMPSLMIGSPHMFEAVVAPEQTVFTFSLRGETRHIYTDGQGHPPADELYPSRMGDSIGHWEGNTLVVETVATSATANMVGDGLSEKARIIERIRLIDKNTMENQIAIDDPVAFTHPWKFIRHYHRDLYLKRLIEIDCEGNDRNPLVDGKFTTIAPPKP